MGMDNRDRAALGNRVIMISNTMWWSPGDRGTVIFVNGDGTEQVLFDHDEFDHGWWCRHHDYRILPAFEVL